MPDFSRMTFGGEAIKETLKQWSFISFKAVSPHNSAVIERKKMKGKPGNSWR